MSLTMVSSNVAGSTKKQLTSAVVFSGYCIGNIIGPQTFLTSEARKFLQSHLSRDNQTLIVSIAGYHSAYVAMLIGYTVKLLCVIVLYVYMWRENKKRDAEGTSDEKAAVEAGMHDLTEIDNKGFRYSL